MKSTTPIFSALLLLLLAGCASAPTGPSQMTLPGTGKSFEQFRSDEAACRQYAHQQASGADQAGANAGVRSAVVGTAVGAVAGAAIGGHEGAGVGAGAGLVVGSMAGSGSAQSAAYGSQRQYDNAYIQCMYAKGHKVPVSGTLRQAQPPAPAAPAPGYYPPPPPGYAPPPPDAR